MISVVIPLYNKEKNIESTLDSLLKQSYSDFEVVVVDDGSTDRSVDVVRSFMATHRQIRLISQPNSGVSATRNRGIKEAQGDYVALIDGDDIWDKDCLFELVRLTIDFPDAAMCGVNYADIIEGNIVPYNQGVTAGFRGYVNDYFGTTHGDLFCASSVILQRDAAIAAGLFDERIRYAEDLDFWYRLILSHPVVFYNKVFAYYNKDADNRAEKDINAHFEITQRWEYYIEKFVPYYKENGFFARFLGTRVAANLLYGNYYFGNSHDRECTNRIVKNLSYPNMPFKYRLIFQPPRCIGWLVYQMSLLKKKLIKA